MRFNMKTIAVEDAVGTVLCQDITRIVRGEFKGAAFRRGHVVTPEDIPLLLDIGKEHLYVFERQPGMVHEDDAARRIAAVVAGPHIKCSEPKEGRINFTADCDGVLTVDEELLFALNTIGDITCATKLNNTTVFKGNSVAASRVTPLIIDEKVLKVMEGRVTRPIFHVTPFSTPDVGIVTTGNEVLNGRVKDSFGPVLREKFEPLGCPVVDQLFTGDDAEKTRDGILSLVGRGCGFICVTGGMSVDPDDQTPNAIAMTGAEVITYGSPIYPGAMFMLAYIDAPQGMVPVLGLPGGVMYAKTSVFDLVVPRLLAGQRLTAMDIYRLGHGGLL